MIFRSPYLRQMPVSKVPQRRASMVAKRVPAVAVLAVFVAVPVWLVALRMPDKEGLWRFLYEIHDTWFLWLKGYLYTLYYPDSLILLALIATLVVMFLFSYMFVLPITRKFHVRLIEYVVAKPPLHRMLLFTVRRLRRLEFAQKLIYEVVRRDRLLALNRIAMSPPAGADHSDCVAAADLTVLFVRLVLIRNPGFPEHLKAATCLHETFSHLLRHANHDSSWFPTVMKNLTTNLDETLRLLTVARDHVENGRETGIEKNDPSLDRIADNLYCLASLYNSEILDNMFSAEIASKPATPARDIVLRRLAVSVNERREELETIRGRLEIGIFRKSRTKIGTQPLDLLSGQKDSLRLKGRLVLGIALDLAFLADMPEIALAYLDLFEALALVSDTVEKRLGSRTAGIADRASGLVGELPASDDYRFCAELSKKRLLKYEEEWRHPVPLLKERVLERKDFDSARARVSALRHAVGPDLDNNDRN